MRDYEKIYEGSKQIISDDKFMQEVSVKLKDKEGLFSDEDNDEISKLELFYRGISNYAYDNFVYPNRAGYHEFYNIKYNDKFYRVGVVRGQGIYFYIKNNKISDNYILFDDIVNNRRLEKARDIDNKMAKIKYLIDSLFGCGVSVDVIREVIDESLNNIEDREIKGKVKLKVPDKKFDIGNW